MRILAALFLAMITSSAHAAEVTPFKECASIRNDVGYTVMGVVRTAGFRTPNGQVQFHEGPFVLEDGENVVVCSTGPFYPGYKVELTLRTIMPIFTCETRLSGDIAIRKRETEDGITELYADCK